MEQYRYIGPSDLIVSVDRMPHGKLFTTISDLVEWISETNQIPDINNEIVATFIISLEGIMHIADRHSEHVVCAGGKNVLSAGEITFSFNEDRIHVPEVTNQSTGYCPDIKSWPVVDRALKKINIEHPDNFTKAFIFRKCDHCGEINLIKDSWFVCVFCDTNLSRDYNIGP